MSQSVILGVWPFTFRLFFFSRLSLLSQSPCLHLLVTRTGQVNSLSVEAADTGGSECRVVHEDADTPTEQDGDARADTETNFEEDPSVIGILQFPAESVDTSLAPVPSRGHLSDVLSAPEISEFSRGEKVLSSGDASPHGVCVKFAVSWRA